MFWPIHRQSSALPDKLALPGQVYLSASVSVVVKGDLLNLQTNNVFLTKHSQQWIKHCGFLRGRVFYDVSLSPNLHDKHFTHHSIITVWNAPHQREILFFFPMDFRHFRSSGCCSSPLCFHLLSRLFFYVHWVNFKVFASDAEMKGSGGALVNAGKPALFKLTFPPPPSLTRRLVLDGDKFPAWRRV